MAHAGLKTITALAAVSLLSACSSFERNQPVPVTDDDALCRPSGAPGSNAYIACRKDRDAQASRGERVERAHRRMSEDMLNESSTKNQPWR